MTTAARRAGSDGMHVPPIKYANADGVSIAYQVIGNTGRTVIGIPGFAQNIDLVWDEPNARRFFERFASIGTLVHFDKRGTGLSDRSLAHPTLEERAADLIAVMDAEQIERAVMAGFSEGATLACFVAATYPERVEGLMIAGGMASYVRRDDHPWARTADEAKAGYDLVEALWGQGVISADFFAPSMAHDDAFRAWACRYERQSINPGRIHEFARYVIDLDIRHLLSVITVPTVVLHAAGDRIIPIESGRYLADHIPGATFVELPGEDHAIWFGSQDLWLASIADFLTGSPESVNRGRALATVMFIDIVDSTQRARALGDARWSELLTRHHCLGTEIAARWLGEVVQSTGDGLLVTFDGPTRAVRAAAEHVQKARVQLGLDVRAGIHCGEIERRGDDIAGIAVHLASRIEGMAPAGGVTISRTVKDLVAGSQLRFSDRGTVSLKGLDEAWQLFDLIL